MDQRSFFMVQVLERLAAPLVCAVIAGKPHGDAPSGESGSIQESRRVAELLGRTVQNGMAIAQAMDLRDEDGEADSVRLALSALSASLISGFYRATGRVPSESDLTRIMGSLEAVMAFADHFAPAAETTARLHNMSWGGVPYDPYQVGVLFFDALVPAIDVVLSFPFGRAEKKLLQEVSEKLITRSRTLRATLFDPAMPEAQARQVELLLLRALVRLYSDCHKAETARLLAMDDRARAESAQKNGGVLSMESVWLGFETRVAMLEALSDIVGSGSSGAASAPAPETEATPPPSAPQPPLPVEADAPQGQAGNPMAFFKKKSSE